MTTLPITQPTRQSSRTFIFVVIISIGSIILTLTSQSLTFSSIFGVIGALIIVMLIQSVRLLIAIFRRTIVGGVLATPLVGMTALLTASLPILGLDHASDHIQLDPAQIAITFGLFMIPYLLPRTYRTPTYKNSALITWVTVLVSAMCIGGILYFVGDDNVTAIYPSLVIAIQLQYVIAYLITSTSYVSWMTARADHLSDGFGLGVGDALRLLVILPIILPAIIFIAVGLLLS